MARRLVEPPQHCSTEFQGEQVCSWDYGGIVLHASRFQNFARVQRHQHKDAYACFLTGGPLHETVNGRRWNHHSPTFIVHPAGEEHQDVFEGPALCVNLKISTAWIKANFEKDTLWPERRAFDHGPLLFLGLRLFHVYHEQDFDSVGLDLEEIAAELLSAGSAVVRHVTVPARLSRVVERLKADPAAPLSLGECARLADVHPVYLARVFRKTYGMSLGEYQRQAKLRHAVRLLASSSPSLVEIASDCGFFDQSHLTKLLRRSTGFTPKELRRSFGVIRRSWVPCVQDCGPRYR